MSQLQNSTNMTNKTHVNNMLQSWVDEEIEHYLVSTNSSNTVKPRYLETMGLVKNFEIFNYSRYQG